jgi:hypothetical protein
MNAEEIEHKIQKIRNDKFIQKIKSSFEQSDDSKDLWNDVWFDHLKKYLTDGRKIISQIDMFPEVAKEIIEFVHWSERTYGSVMYDFMRQILIKSEEPDLKDIEEWDEATIYFDDIAVKLDQNWFNVVDELDAYMLQEIEDYFKIGFQLINHPTYDSLIGLNKNHKRNIEMQYIMSIGLFILFESFMGNV